jgi:uncharacterized protein YciI
MNRKHFFVKLILPRPTFTQDMTDGERSIMNKHIEYWNEKMNIGMVVVFGPVFDPKGGYGMGVIEAENEDEARDFAAGDPAGQAGLVTYEIYPMKAVKPEK